MLKFSKLLILKLHFILSCVPIIAIFLLNNYFCCFSFHLKIFVGKISMSNWDPMWELTNKHLTEKNKIEKNSFLVKLPPHKLSRSVWDFFVLFFEIVFTVGWLIGGVSTTKLDLLLFHKIKLFFFLFFYKFEQFGDKISAFQFPSSELQIVVLKKTKWKLQPEIFFIFFYLFWDL